LISSTANESRNLHSAELVFHFLQSDLLLYQIVQTLKAQLETDGGSALSYVKSLTTFLCVHLLKKYSAYQPKLSQFTNGLSNSQLRLAINYINNYLEQEIKLVDLAALMEMNFYHFATLFKRSTGVSPYQYIIKCRLEKAKRLLADKNLSIADIAIQCGFANQSHLSKTFRQHLAMTPKTYRNTLHLISVSS
jgi:AraC family transcriptional regulator